MGASIQIDDRAAKEIRKLPAGLKADFVKLMKMVQQVGLRELPARRVKHMGTDGLLEFRMSKNNMEGRALFVQQPGEELVILSAFQKKTQQTPVAEMKKAKGRLSEFKRDLTCPSPLTI
ncbi:MAG: type II toxin-antitoxin system RelE/ParE family toxin [Alphaproteobacteria bacterium]